MKGSLLIKIYCTLTLISIFIEMILTRNILKRLSNIEDENVKKIFCKYQLVYTKVLLLLDTFYYASFYLEKKISSIIQLQIVKIINITVWFVIALDSGFDTYFVIFFAIQAFALLTARYSSSTECGHIYTQYNHKISTDLNIINMHIVSEIIRALKSAIALFLLILIYEDFLSGTWNHYRILTYLKAMTFVIDRALQQRDLDVYIFNILSVVLFGSLNIYGLYYTYTLFRDEILPYNEIFVFLELVTLIKILLILYYMYLNRKK